VAVAVLAVIVGVMATVTRDVQDAWRRGESAIEQNSRARIVLQTLRQDLECALADSLLRFRCGTNDNGVVDSFGLENDTLSFVTLVGAPDATRRHARLIQYRVQPSENQPSAFELVRSQVDLDPGWLNQAPLNAYWNSAWVNTNLPSACVLANQVAGFGVQVPRSSSGQYSEYDSAANSNRLPEYVDIYLELLDLPSAREVRQQERRNRDPTDWVDTHTWKHTTRVFLHHRESARHDNP
jgi:hypothetical protein